MHASPPLSVQRGPHTPYILLASPDLPPSYKPARYARSALLKRGSGASLRQPGLPETLIVSLYELVVFRVIRRRALLDHADREAGRADLLADSQGRACFALPT